MAMLRISSLVVGGVVGLGSLGLSIAAWHPAPASAREGVVLVAGLTEGKELLYDIRSRVESKRGEKTDVLEQQARVRLTVEKVDADAAASVKVKFESLRGRRRSGENDEAWRWDGGEAPGGESAMAKVYGALAKEGMTLKVSAAGLVEEAGAPAVEGVDARAAAGVAGVFGAETIKRQFAPIFGLDPSRSAHKAGDTWSRKHSQQILAGTEAITTTTYTLDSLKDGKASLTGKLSMELSKHESATKEVEPEVQATVREGKDKVEWDAAAARLVSRVLDSSVTVAAKLDVLPPIESSTTTTLHVEVRLVEEGKKEK
jgi:hypothetical protein